MRFTVCVTRVACAGLIALVLAPSAAAAQRYGPEDALPPGATGAVLSLRGAALDLRPVVLQLRGTVLPLSGAVTDMRPKVDPLQTALKDLGATVKAKEIKINLAADVLFDFDRAELRPEAGPALQNVAAVLKGHPKAATLIEGHTDGKGKDAYNQALSERRADSVRRWLAANGIASPITTRGWGRRKPIAPNAKPNGADDPEGRQKNRRVEITVKTP